MGGYECGFGDGVVLEILDVGVGQRPQDSGCDRALDGNESPALGDVVDEGVDGGAALGQCWDHARHVRGVGNDQVPALGEAVDHQIVDDAAVWCADHRVAGTAHTDAGGRSYECVVHEGRGVGAADFDLAHVGEVEETRCGPDGVVFGDV